MASIDITKLLLQTKYGTPAQKMAAETVLEVFLQIGDEISSPVEKSVIARPTYLEATDSILKSKYRKQHLPALVEAQVDVYKSAGTYHTFHAWLDKNAAVLDSLDKDVKDEVIQKAKSEYTKGLLARMSTPAPLIQVKARGTV